ncbi:isoflavone reductase [Podospora aff. communis PSN243]|uniref:Isoflavone reductase n=1 Tax=Podospora aff. communis PSN243 TaxID=3040156 RepID=A0AAV9GFA0_9PEZI|nr:isoflavone reductase [Podospora aff. communis PSN243]
MAIVAVPGGTGNVGRSIVEALLASGKHQVKVLSRKPNPILEAEIGAPILAVDYSNVDAITKVLEDNNIDTVISGIAMHSIDGSRPHELEMIRAADKSKTTKRMISSDWGTPVKEEDIGAIPSIIHKWDAQKALNETKDLEWTVFHNGFFLDYWGLPGVKSHMINSPLVNWLDVANNAAAIPGVGNTPALFTHTTDVARFVVASLDLPKWDRATFIYGDKVTWNEMVRYAEEAKGTKFTVTYDSVERMKKGETTELPGQIPLYKYIPKGVMQDYAAIFGLWFDSGAFDLKPEKFLNETFPEIKPMTAKEMLDKAWRK